MLWQGRRESGNVEDRRGMSGGGMVAGGGILGVIALVLNFLLGGGGGSGGGNGQMAPLPGQHATQQRSAEEDQLAHFVKVVLADTEDVWGQLLRKAGEQYPAPTLVLFTGQVQSGCGYASAQTGPFSVKMELQADYYAGVFAHYEQGKGYLEAGDMEEALRAANAIGDDNLQKQAQGYAVPESFTHGTSAQRMYWFKKGYETGDISQGDTFNSPDL
jgi:predicted metalloprotease